MFPQNGSVSSALQHVFLGPRPTGVQRLTSFSKSRGRLFASIFSVLLTSTITYDPFSLSASSSSERPRTTSFVPRSTSFHLFDPGGMGLKPTISGKSKATLFSA